MTGTLSTVFGVLSEDETAADAVESDEAGGWDKAFASAHASAEEEIFEMPLISMILLPASSSEIHLNHLSARMKRQPKHFSGLQAA
jgi:hypothetical protein